MQEKQGIIDLEPRSADK